MKNDVFDYNIFDESALFLELNMEDKLDKIHEAVTELNTNVKLIQQEIKVMNERGCESSVKAIAKTNERIDSNDREHTFIKGVAYAGGLVGSVMGYLLSYFNSK